MKLSSHLILLVLAAVVPLLIFTSVMFWRDIQDQRDAIHRGMRDTAHALSLAVDREVGSVRAVLETLAASRHLDSGDFKSFYALSSRVAKKHQGSWVVLFDRSGQQIINTRRPFGVSLPNTLRETKESSGATKKSLPLGSAWTIKRVLETGESMVSDLFIGIVSQRPSLVITVPVIRNGKVAYALDMGMLPEHFIGLLQEQRLSAGWFAAIVDRRGTIIARTLGPERIGTPARPELIAETAKSDEGWNSRQSFEDMAVDYAFTRSKLTGWTTDVAAPHAVLYAPMSRSIWITAVGAALLLVFGLSAAFILGRRISGPISTLAGSAEAIQRGERVEMTPSTVQEVTELREALVAAGEASRRSRAEEALRESDRRFRSLVSEVRDYAILMLDTGGRVASWNLGAQRIKGYEEKEIVGEHFSRFYPPEAVAEGIPDRILRAGAANGRFEGEGWRMRKDGSRFWANVVITALHDERGQLIGFSKVTRDLTARKRAETELRQSEERFRLTVESAPNGIIVADEHGRIALVNSQVERLLGYSRDELLGHSVDLLVPGRFRNRHPQYRAEFSQAPQGRPMGAGRDLYARRKDGSEIPVEIGLNPLRTDGGVFILTSIVDITERKRAEEALKQFNEQLEGRVAERTAELATTNEELVRSLAEREKLEADLREAHKMQAVGTMAGGIAHDFNNLLAIIMGHASELKGDGLRPEEYAESVEAILTASQRGAATVQQLLTFARRTPIARHDVKVDELLREFVRMIQPVFPVAIGLSVETERISRPFRLMPTKSSTPCSISASMPGMRCLGAENS